MRQGSAEAIALVLCDALHGPADGSSQASAQILLGGARELTLQDQPALKSRASLVIGSGSDPSALDVISPESGRS